jgi:Zn ribbon nucleic-acid-binding protein
MFSPITPLAASAELRGTIENLLTLLRLDGLDRFVGESIASWEERNVHLAQCVICGDDDALVELVRRDPRYLGTELVAAKVLLWKLQVVHGAKHSRRGASRHRTAGEAARRKLDKLAAAVRVVTGRGNKMFVGHLRLLRDYEDALDRVRCVIKQHDEGASDKKIARAVKLDKNIVDKIIRKRRQVNQHAEELTLDVYKHQFGVQRLRTLLREARKRVVESD